MVLMARTAFLVAKCAGSECPPALAANSIQAKAATIIEAKVKSQK
jgi:hypothetical protein